MKNTLITIFALAWVMTAMATEKNKPETAQVTTTKNVAGDHNSTRSNRGALVAPKDTDDIADNELDELHNIAQAEKGRNPQTGKEINVAKKADRTGRNPQTGKDINVAKSADLTGRNPQTGKEINTQKKKD